MYQEVDGRLIEVRTMGRLSLGWLKDDSSHFNNRDLSPQPFVQLFWGFDNWPLNRGWLLKWRLNCIIFVGKLQCRASHTSDAGLMAFLPQ